jgi:tRNA 2-selenouridine synthase
MIGASEQVLAKEFLSHSTLCIDVRSPIEYAQGHVVGAYNLPLFTDDERAQIGTLYKKQGQQQAIELGIYLVSPKLPKFLEELKQIQADKEPLRVYCFRGGLRSNFASWFYQFIGYKTKTLKGGYKAFRRCVLETFKQKFQLIVLGGYTGSGKTKILHELRERGEQIIDLEALAFHRGSSFGLTPGDVQPSNEHLENKIAVELLKFDQSKPIWVEDESRLIGACMLPDAFFQQMKTAHLFLIETPIEDRIKLILEMYGRYPEGYLIACTEKIQKRLGLERTKRVIEYIRAKELDKAFSILLEYYDSSYMHSSQKHVGPKITVDADINQLLKAKSTLLG